jgi:hypothetical protein
MSRSPAHEIAILIDDADIGSFPADAGWAINVAAEPSSPDTTITIYDTPGGAPVIVPETQEDDSEQLRDVDFQVRVRSGSYQDAYLKQQEIFNALTIPKEQATADHRIVGIWLVGDIASIGRDDNNRHRLVANYRMERQPLEDLS